MDHKVRKSECEALFFEHIVTENMQIGSFASHTHNSYELLYVLGGDVTLTVEDRKYKLKKDDLALVRPLNYHFTHIDSVCEYDRFNFLFEPSALGISNIDLLPKSTDVYSLRHHPHVSEIIKKIDYYSLHLSKRELKEVTALLVKELIYNLIIISKTELNKKSSSAHPLISRALEIINSELYSKITVSDVAKKLFVTESYLFRLFKEELGITPAKYVMEKRMLTAKNLLSVGEMPTKVYSECGFADYTSFYRSYVRFFGYSPSLEKTNITEI